MNVGELVPPPIRAEPFRRDRQSHVPAVAGCYALTTLTGLILYVGLTVNLRARMGNHLDTPEKVSPTPHGRAVFFHWLAPADTQAVERAWLNAHQLATGLRPVLNKADSPVSC